MLQTLRLSYDVESVTVSTSWMENVSAKDWILEHPIQFVAGGIGTQHACDVHAMPGPVAQRRPG